jgi:hypothetical protein
MISKTEHKRHLVDLEFLQKILENSGLKTDLTPASEENPVSFLVGVLSQTIEEKQVAIQFAYIPGEELEEVALLQCYFFLTTPILQEHHDDVQKLIPMLNARSILGHFDIDDSSQFFNRYVYVLPRSEAPKEAPLLEMITLAIHNFFGFCSFVLQLNQGLKTLEEVVAAITEQ